MTETMAIPLHHHAEMLSDRIRLELYEKAIRLVVRAQDNVVDIGSGFGLLGAYAAACTSGSVCSIEYFDEVSSVGRELFRSDPKHVVISARSYDVELESPPDVLITETIGPIGPEENIVELTYDFKQRHPDIREIIPRTLGLYAQTVRSESVDMHFHEVMNGILTARSDAFRIDRLAGMLEEEYCRQVYQSDLSDSVMIGERQRVAEYRLGIDATSSIHQILRFDPEGNWNAVNIHFDADLADGIVLRNTVDAGMTHWMHSFVRRPGRKCELALVYDSEDCTFKPRWLD